MRLSNIFAGIVLIAFVLCPQSSVAQQAKKAPTQKQLLSQYLNSAGYLSYLQKIVNLVEHPAVKTGCSELKLITGNQYVVLKQPEFIRAGGNYSIDQGAWIARVLVDRCGAKVYRRVLLEAVRGKNQLKPTPLLPGDFRGNLKLEYDARRIVIPVIGAKSACKDYKKIAVVDVKAGNKGSAKGWWETWTTRACDKTILAAVKYFASGKGMQIVAKVGKVGETPSWAE